MNDHLNETMCGIVENGSWVLIPHPALRDLVGRYIADAVAEIAAVIGDEEARKAALDVRGTGALPIAF